ncbi:MAG: GNAT family N-acetyltransferase [Microthrixaceae bacterium]
MIHVRRADSADEAALAELTYLALWVPEGAEPFERRIVDEPQIRHYFEDFPRRVGDLGFLACEGDDVLGGCWARYFPSEDPGYGWVAADVPELSIAVAAERRGEGIGRRLLLALFDAMRERGDTQLSLSVDPQNPARLWYDRLGFSKVGVVDGSWTMTLDL